MKRVAFRLLLTVLAGVLPLSARAAEVCEAPPTSDPLMIREVPNPYGSCTELAADQHQWGAYALNLPGAWARVTGRANLGVADLGLDVEHPDLQDLPPGFGPTDTPGNFRLHLSYDFRRNDSCPDELQTTDISTGCPGDLTGARGPQNTPEAGHGTHVSGIAAANFDNSEGVAGTCQRCSLIMSRGRFTNESPDLAVRPFYWAVDRGAQVVNGSFGFEPRAFGTIIQCPILDPGMPATPDSFTRLCSALALADQRDVMIVASAGNDREGVDFPASDPRSIAVGGIEVDGSLWRRDDDPGEVCPFDNPNTSDVEVIECGSNTGPELDLVAPAERILSTAYRGRVWFPSPDLCGERASTPGYGPCTGTSMAAPFVSGIAGLVRSANPLLRKNDVYSILIADARREGCADDPSALWDPECGYGVPDAEAAVRRALGAAGGQTLVNRLTPLFSLYSETAEDHLYTTVPQVASSAYHGLLYENCTELLRENCTVTVPYVPFGPAIPWYAGFPGASCTVSPCIEPPAGASVYLFTTDTPPFPGAVLVPLYRMSYRGPNAAGDNPLNRDTAYTTESAGILAFRNATFPGSSEGYELDGIEGWIFKKCTPEPGCIPPGAVRLYRRYNEVRDDFAIFPEAELPAMVAQGYTSDGGAGTDVLGYVYPNADADGDLLIDGFELLAGTDPAQADSDCDGTSDGTEVLLYPYGDPRSSTCVDNPPVPSFTVSCFGLRCTFDGRGSTDDRGISNWSWSFGDTASGNGSMVTHDYPVKGTYPVVLTVTDTGNQSVFTNPPRNVYVDALPVPRFTFTCTGRTCTFDGRASTDDVGINSYFWSFGDGTTGTGPTIVHTFPGSGPYPVTLRVTDTHNQSVTSSPQELREDLPPVPCFTHACTGLSCTFDARCSTDDRGIVSWSWSFGDGTGGTGQIVTHLYPRKDLFTATLTVTDTGSQTRSTSKTLDLRNDPPDARDDGWSTYRNVATNVPYWNLLRNDFDPNGDALTVTGVNTAGLTGTLDCTVSSSYCLYSPPSWFIGTTSFTYTASDGRGGTDTATVRIKVGVNNNLPVPGVDLLTTRRGTALPFTQATLLANDTDADGDVLFVESVTPRYGVGFGTVSCTTPVYNCTYTPPAGFIGVDNVDYRVMDGISQSLGRVAFTVEPPTPAVLDAREDQIFTTTTTTYISYTLLLSNDYDPEAGPLTVVSVDTAGLLGTLDCTTYPTGCEYRRGTSDPTRFRYTVRDNQGNLDTATVTLKPGNWAFNKVPQTAPDQLMTARNTPVGFSIFHLLRNDHDPDNDQLNVFVNWSSPSGRVSCTTPQYFCTYTPNVGFAGVDTVGYTVNDGTNSATGTLTVTVSP